MALIIDGYNLLHATDLFGRGSGPGGLERSRMALLNFLAATLAPAERERTTVVFDAAEAPPGLPRQYRHEGLHIHFAANYDDADAMIEELIRANHSPRQLLVVSSDHRLHRAAQRRRAKAIDSDRWYAEMVARRRKSAAPVDSEGPAKLHGALSPAEVQHWLREFGETNDSARRAGENLDADLAEDAVFPPGYLEEGFDDE